MSDSSQTIVLTGASAGVGRATAREFAKRGARIALVARNEDALHAAAEREHLAAAQLRELDRMRTELVAVVAHDLRAPVGLIQHLAHRLAVDWETVADEENTSFCTPALRITLSRLTEPPTFVS